MIETALIVIFVVTLVMFYGLIVVPYFDDAKLFFADKWNNTVGKDEGDEH